MWRLSGCSVVCLTVFHMSFVIIYCFQLTAPPVNTRALSFLSSVAGEALTKHLAKILPALLTSLSEKMGTPDEQEVRKYAMTIMN